MQKSRVGEVVGSVVLLDSVFKEVCSLFLNWVVSVGVLCVWKDFFEKKNVFCFEWGKIWVKWILCFLLVLKIRECDAVVKEVESSFILVFEFRDKGRTGQGFLSCGCGFLAILVQLQLLQLRLWRASKPSFCG